ncbi:DUF2171 domain-containing protein [Pseudonocardia nigra]|uniref:DUF2171 domain-containing protein n=1 Tax=Pseudonocardia nigra TaxID=1921578 RepID=UPI001C5FBD68|nr:DUF2171 domain-containing protein [Pseudonocardia nigra]
MSTPAFGTGPVSGEGASGDGPIAQVRTGMRVVDVGGADVGTVETVKMGDPEAVTEEGQTPQGGGLGDIVRNTFGGGEPHVPEQLAARLLRVGFVKVDGKGLFGRDFYVPADQVGEVDGDAVHLTVSGDELTRES